MNKIYLLILFSICFFNLSIAQNKWMYLPNIGLHRDTLWRMEDIYFTDTSTGYAVALSNRIFKTTNGGVHWRIVNDTAIKASYRSVEFLDDKMTGLAGSVSTNGRVCHTTDGGETWSDITSKIPDTSKYAPLRICGIGHFGNTFYAVGAWTSKTAKFYKSNDKGDSWVTHYIDTNLATSLIDVWFVSKDTGFITGAKFSNIPPTYRQTGVILRTSDGGSSWQSVFSDTVFGGYVWKIQFIDRQHAVGALQNWYMQDSICMLRSHDGGNSWAIIPVGNRKGLKNPDGGTFATQACGFATPAKGWVGGYYEGIFETNDSGKTWTYMNFGYDFNRIFVIDSNHIFAGGNVPYKYGSGIDLSIPNRRNAKTQSPHVLHQVIPNPSDGNVKISFDIMNETNIVLMVVNLDNRITYKIANTSLPKGSYSYCWNGQNEPPGNYMIWLGNNEIPQIQKFTLFK